MSLGTYVVYVTRYFAKRKIVEATDFGGHIPYLLKINDIVNKYLGEVAAIPIWEYAIRKALNEAKPHLIKSYVEKGVPADINLQEINIYTLVRDVLISNMNLNERKDLIIFLLENGADPNPSKVPSTLCYATILYNSEVDGERRKIYEEIIIALIDHKAQTHASENIEGLARELIAELMKGAR